MELQVVLLVRSSLLLLDGEGDQNIPVMVKPESPSDRIDWEVSHQQVDVALQPNDISLIAKQDMQQKEEIPDLKKLQRPPKQEKKNPTFELSNWKNSRTQQDNKQAGNRQVPN